MTMNKLNMDDVAHYVETNIDAFHQKRYDAINKLKLNTILKKKNPYLFKAKSIQTAGEIVKGLTDAFLSSHDETIFGDWLEGLAIFVNQKVFNVWKSGIQGIDLEFDKENTRYIVSIKSSPNWGNSSQVAKLKSIFITAKKTLRTSNSKLHIEAINGCCCGIDNNPDKGEYFKICGQAFWTFISDNENLYIDIIEPLGNKAKERNEEFQKLYAQTINKFTLQFIQDFCKSGGEIDWEKIVKYNSEKKAVR
ncbi:hypothetical protein AGMMS50229_04050 [Campylobacterota bacterium]|nr:hypothetical protein AGMMS50229_04050 [Campylobacterota bacterium]